MTLVAARCRTPIPGSRSSAWTARTHARSVIHVSRFRRENTNRRSRAGLNSVGKNRARPRPTNRILRFRLGSSRGDAGRNARVPCVLHDTRAAPGPLFGPRHPARRPGATAWSARAGRSPCCVPPRLARAAEHKTQGFSLIARNTKIKVNSPALRLFVFLALESAGVWRRPRASLHLPPPCSCRWSAHARLWRVELQFFPLRVGTRGGTRRVLLLVSRRAIRESRGCLF